MNLPYFLGIDKSTLNYFLSRKTKSIRIENLLYICEALKITLSEFFDDTLFYEVEAVDWKKNKKN